jgi:hypothetical protein
MKFISDAQMKNLNKQGEKREEAEGKGLKHWKP